GAAETQPGALLPPGRVSVGPGARAPAARQHGARSREVAPLEPHPGEECGDVGHPGAVGLERLYLLERVAERGRGLGELTALEPRPTLPRVHEADGAHPASLPTRAHRRIQDV